MKILFGTDVTKNKRNDEINGKEFITASNPDDALRAYDRSSEQLRKISEAAGIPLILRIIRAFAAVTGVITLTGILIQSFATGTGQAYVSVPYLFMLCAAAWMTYGAVTMVQKGRNQKVCDDPKTEATLSSVEKSNRELYHGLGVPDDAPDTDVLSFCYVMENGRPVMRERGFAGYLNLIVRIYTTNTYFCLADVSDLYSIPLDEVKGMRTEKEMVLSISEWHKDENYTDGKFRKYHITEDKAGQLRIKGCCVLVFVHRGEEWEIWFPSYEQDRVRELLKEYIPA